MKPTTTLIIKGIQRTFEDHIAPRLETKREQGMVRSIMCLLDHLSVRAEHEGQLLSDDIHDMRTSFRELSDTLAASPLVNCSAELKAMLAAMKENLGKEYRQAGAYPTIASLTEESDSLKQTLARTIEVLHAHKRDLTPEVYAKADEAIRQVLTRQMEREGTLIQPFIGKRVY